MMWQYWKRLYTVFVLMTIAFEEFEAVAKKPKCGYDSCPKGKGGFTNVHIVPHTHDDVGWLKTVDQYFYGTRTYSQKANVEAILDSVIRALLENPARKFIYVESAFFFKWWRKQSQHLQQVVQQLVDQGRLEFIGGAWSMNDEAATHYQSTIDHFTWGLRKINDTFGECGRPKIGWQIDPFGHSREFASMLTQMGYDGLFLGRIDYQDKAKRLSSKTAEMIWHASDSLGEKAYLFTGVLFNIYLPPTGFCFDIMCGDEPIVDDKNSTEYNVDRKLDELFKFVYKQANTTRTNNIILTFGGDFAYMDAFYSFTNLDKLIDNINKRQSNGSKINAFYSTPSCYLKALNDSNISWPTKSDDFFPYASDVHSYWTGYFTSRPALKRFERIGNHYLQVCKQLSVLVREKTENFDANLDNLREIMGVMQHHDAVSGTEKQHVANDYARLLQIGIDKCSENIKESLNQLSVKLEGSGPVVGIYYNFNSKDLDKIRLAYDNCADLNISACNITENSSKFVVTLYNPLGHSAFQYVRVPVSAGHYEVFDHANKSVDFEFMPIPKAVRDLSFRESKADSELVFLADNIPPLGYKSYFVQKESERKTVDIPTATTENNNQTSDKEQSGPFSIGSEHLKLTFDGNGLLQSAATRNVKMEVQQNFYVYKSSSGFNFRPESRASGAYIFRPNNTEASQIVSSADVKIIRGKLFHEVHQTFNEYLSQVIRVSLRENYAEFEWLVGPLPNGTEIISRFDTDIKSNGLFYTDSNGREMMKRKRDHRDTWNVRLSEKISGNYYPVTTKIAIEDDTRRFALLTDRAQGGSSLTDGSIELMVHRRLLRDDSFGVGEVLNEQAFGKGLIVRGKHYFMFDKSSSGTEETTEAKERSLQLRTLLPSWLFFSNASHLIYEEWRVNYNNNFSALSLSLPKNIHLLTFEPWKENFTLIRFEYILAKDEAEQHSQAITFNFQDVFRSWDIISIRETTLSANQWLEDSKRVHFRSEEKKHNKTVAGKSVNESKNQQPVNHRKSSNENITITLKPMEIRTFIVQIRKNSEDAASKHN